MKKYLVIWFFIILFIPASPNAQNKKYILDADISAILINNCKKEYVSLIEQLLPEINNNKELSLSGIIKFLNDKLKKQNLEIEDCFLNNSNLSAEEFLQSKVDSGLSENIVILKNRLNQFGVQDFQIRKSGSNRIIAETNGIKEEVKIKTLLVTRGYLSFHLVREKEYVKRLINEIDSVLGKVNPGISGNQFSELISFEYASGLNEMPVHVKSIQAIELMLNNPKVKAILPVDIEFAWSERLIKTDVDSYTVLYILEKTPVFDGSVITDAGYFEDSANGTPHTSIIMSSEGAAILEKVTGENLNRECAIVFDGKVFSTPRIMAKITGGKLNISGLSSLGEAMLLPIILKSGSLAIPLKLASENGN